VRLARDDRGRAALDFRILDELIEFTVCLDTAVHFDVTAVEVDSGIDLHTFLMLPPAEAG
jgi:hypothetical protein